ncbi:MAG TPA: GNAT family N-acetyltransferase [Gammaproteobacteria bacterium]|nr:GNAT family N-acetyltransferase [Gammaproteobacteria bacterium]
MLHKDEWLSQYFKGGAYSYRKSDNKDYQKIHEGFIYTKIPSHDQNEINLLIKDDFKLVEVSVLFEQKNSSFYQPRLDVDIDFVKPKEKQEVVEIAKNAFLTSRLYQDSRIPYSIASQIKEDWVANYFSGQRGDNMIVAHINEKTVGFLLLINQTTIDLVAVSPNYYRMAIASSMIGFANLNFGLLRAGTQLNNQAAIAMYEKCGFFLTQSYFVLHKFIG